MTTSPETVDAPPIDVGEGEEGLAKGSITLSGVLFVSIATMAPGRRSGLRDHDRIAVLRRRTAAGRGRCDHRLRAGGGGHRPNGQAHLHRRRSRLIRRSRLSPRPRLCHRVLRSDVLPGRIALSGAGVRQPDRCRPLPPQGGAAYKATWIVAGLGCLLISGAFNYFGAAFSTKAGVILGSLEILVLLGMSIHMIMAAGSNNSLSVFTTEHANVEGFTGISGVIAASVYAFLAFIGFEAGAPLAAETKDPQAQHPPAPSSGPRSSSASSTSSAAMRRPRTSVPTSCSIHDLQRRRRLDRDRQEPMGGAGWIVLLLALLNSSVACANGASMGGTRHIWAMAHAGTIPQGLRQDSSQVEVTGVGHLSHVRNRSRRRGGRRSALGTCPPLPGTLRDDHRGHRAAGAHAGRPVLPGVLPAVSPQ